MAIKYFIQVATIDEAREYISEIEVEKLNDGDQAEVTFPDKSKQVYVFRDDWTAKIRTEYSVHP